MSALTLFTPNFTPGGPAIPGDVIVIPTSSAAGTSATIPLIPKGGSGTMIDQLSWYYIIVAGSDCYIAYNTPAVAGVAALVPISNGMSGFPVRIAPGTVVECLGVSTGQVSLVRAIPVQS